MLEEERGYRLFKVPGGEKKERQSEREISSCLFSLEISHQQCGGKTKKRRSKTNTDSNYDTPVVLQWKQKFTHFGCLKRHRISERTTLRQFREGG